MGWADHEALLWIVALVALLVLVLSPRVPPGGYPRGGRRDRPPVGPRPDPPPPPPQAAA